MRRIPAMICIPAAVILVAAALAILLPVCFTLLGSLMNPGEIEHYFGPVYEGTAEETVRLHLLPDRLWIQESVSCVLSCSAHPSR